MSNKSNVRFLVALLFAATACAALVLADVSGLPQNSNSSTTGDESAQNANMTAAPRRGRGRRGRGRRRATPAATTDAGSAIDPQGTMAAGQSGGTSGDISGEQTDLSGTYTGHVTMTGGHEMNGQGTLTITGNTFSLESEGMTHNGRVYAVVTRGYIGAAFYFPDIMNPATNTPVVANVRARKTGDRLTLTPVPGASTRMTFGAAGGGTRRPRPRRGRRAAPATDANANANTGDGSATPPM